MGVAKMHGMAHRRLSSFDWAAAGLFGSEYRGAVAVRLFDGR
jgi:hypothetical protein